MWISRKDYDQQTLERVRALQEARDLSEQLIGCKATSDWLKVRVNHLERQNAVLLYAKTGVELPFPKIEQRPIEKPEYNALPDFEDVGDIEAARLGIRHASDGTLIYDK